jgi:hypothetical protein
MPLIGTVWSGTAPGLPGTQTISGTITSASDLSTYTTQAMVGVKADMKDTTNFGSGAYYSEIPGIKHGSVTLAFQQDYAASALDAIIRTTMGGLGVLVYLDLKPTVLARSVTNPSFVCAFYIADYTFVNGNVGDKNALSFPITANGKFDWLTT